MGFDSSRAASSAKGIPADFARVSKRAAFWAFSFNSVVVKGMLFCEMVDNSRMPKDGGVGAALRLVSDV